MKATFLTMGDQAWASSRYRCYWPAQYMANTSVYQWQTGGEIPDDADVYIWQKQANLAAVEQIAADGKTQIWDLCDPVYWWQPTEARFIADRCKAVVCSSDGLTADFSDWYGLPAVCIRDRFEMSHFIGGKAQHNHADPVRFIWYGISNNRLTLLSALANLERLAANGVNMTLTICDDSPEAEVAWTDRFPIYYTRWSLGAEVKTIASHDIAILPQYPGPWGRVKSDNKRITAQLCGVPWHDGQDYDDLHELATSAQLRSDRATDIDRSRYNVKVSAQEWEALINGFAEV